MVPEKARVLPAAGTVADDRHDVMRRLTDKILAAFNHAYAVGEVAIAERLREVLAVAEATCNGTAERRTSYDPLGQAATWVEFVEARNRYKWICENRRNDPSGAAEALTAMKDAYRRWSLS
jgi:hypothetical protein